jgi:hypothetical protein
LTKQTKEAEQKREAGDEAAYIQAPTEKEKTRERKILVEKEKEFFFVGWWM